MIDYSRLRRTIYHGLPRPDLPTQDHDVWLLLDSMFDRLDALEADVLLLIDEAEEEEEEEESYITLLSSQPADGQTEVQSTDTITLTFSEPITFGVGNPVVLSGGSPQSIASLSSDGADMIIVLETALSTDGQEVTVTVGTDVVFGDETDDGLENEVVITFTMDD